MTSGREEEPLWLIERALGQAAAVIEAVRPVSLLALGAEMPVRAEAPAYDRRAGWFGGDPSRSPSA